MKHRHIEHEIVLKMVREIREDHPRIGTRKLYHMLQDKLALHRIKMGRDALFNLLSANQLLVRKRKRRIYTTRSQHWFRKYTNLIKDIELTTPNQLWASDITYVEYHKGFLYLSLVTDAFSRKVVGYHIAENLEAVNTLQALQMALRQCNGSMKGLIHHSDRGIQYCCYEYVDLLKDYDIAISMTETGDPRDNPLAERMNGIIKDEYLLNYQIKDINDAKALLNRSVSLYNDKRPHLSLNMDTPEQKHQTIEC
jgi:transposase InsO family protein